MCLLLRTWSAIRQMPAWRESFNHIWIPDLGKLTSCLPVINPWLPRDQWRHKRYLLLVPCPPCPQGRGWCGVGGCPHMDFSHKMPGLVEADRARCVSGREVGRGSQCGWLTEGQMAKAPTHSGCPKEALSSCVRSHNAEERCPRSPRNPFLTVHVFPA